MAAYAALVSLLNNIHAITNHPTLSTCLHHLPIQPLLEKTNFLLDFMEGNSYGAGSKKARDLERKIASAAHAAEDLIESHIVDRIHEERLTWPYLQAFMPECEGCHVGDKYEKSLDLQQIMEAMNAIMKEANEFKEERRLGVEQLPTNLGRPLTDSGETGMVGLDDELNQLLNELTGYESSRHIISIVGMGGMGKTTLAKNVYKHLLIKEQFQCRAWATISQQNNARETLSKLLSELGQPDSGTIDELGVRLYRTLSLRRYLIVLDDIWSVEAWNEVKHYFPDTKNRSRVVLTTRLSNVAKDCGSSLFEMNFLDEDNSWKLSCEKAFQNKHCPPELGEVGGEIVKLCKGLALSIVVIGGLLLKSPITVGYWKEVTENLKSTSNSKEKQQSFDVLSLSYHHLPPHLKPCFLYMRLFKEDSEIPVLKIINLWVADGFVKPIDSRVLEEIAEGFIKDLIDRNLILVNRRHKNGNVRSCGIHDLLRDLCIKLGEQEEFFHVITGGERGTERRMVVDELYAGRTGVRLPLIRSIMAKELIQKPTGLIGYRLLRVFKAHPYTLQVDIHKNVNLRYLDYCYSTGGPFEPSVVELPTSIPLMWNLQTLYIYTFGNVVVAPTEFWKMRQLRHVQADHIYLPCPPSSNEQDEGLMLENLHTIKRVVNLRLCEEACKMIPNIKKLHLVYDNILPGYDDSLIEYLCNLDRLHKLESLNLDMNSNIYLNEKQYKLTASFPMSLKKLSLSSCKVESDDLAMIGSLPQLEVLYLNDLFLGGEGEGQWSPVDGQFPRLKFLEIRSFDLVCWDADASHFPTLEKLILFDLWRLEEIPLGFSDIPTLELIRVEYCTNSAAISAIRIKEDNLEYDGQLLVQVEMAIGDQYSTFKQMLETEGLTTDNIELKTSERIVHGSEM